MLCNILLRVKFLWKYFLKILLHFHACIFYIPIMLLLARLMGQYYFAGCRLSASSVTLPAFSPVTVKLCLFRFWGASADVYRTASKSSTYSPEAQIFLRLRSAVWRQHWRHRLPAGRLSGPALTVDNWAWRYSWLTSHDWSEEVALVCYKL